MPLAAETVEVVDKNPAHERLDGPVNIVEWYALLDYFVPVYFHELLWHAGQEGGAQGRYLRTFARRRQEGVQVVCEELDIITSTVFKDEGKSSGSADPGNRRG